MAAALKMPNNTPGVDGLLQTDLNLASPLAFDRLAQLCNCAEEGKGWPKAVTTARKAFLDKKEDNLDAGGYRGLSMLSKLYLNIRYVVHRFLSSSWFIN